MEKSFVHHHDKHHGGIRTQERLAATSKGDYSFRKMRLKSIDLTKWH